MNQWLDLEYLQKFLNNVQISSNGFLTFSGVHHSVMPGMTGVGGETYPIPSTTVPNGAPCSCTQPIDTLVLLTAAH